MADGQNTSLICRLTGLSRVTVWDFLESMSACLTEKFYQRIQKIGGNGLIVEVDESKFGKCKYNRGHHVDGVWVVGMVERTAQRRILLFPVRDNTRDTLVGLLTANVHSESIVDTDCWAGYNSLSMHFTRHMTVNHSEGFKNPITGVHTNTIEGNWGSVNAQTPVRCRTQELVSAYLIRHMIKRNSPGHELEEVIKYLQ